jgi:FG-GAP repeat
MWARPVRTGTCSNITTIWSERRDPIARPAWHEVAAADFNGDGKADILWQKADGTPAVWLMDGFNVVAGSNVSFDPGAGWHMVPPHHDLFG